jgi:hypothetical protein
MIHAHLDKQKAVPLWAAIGAPLIGVPLMVALLALMAPAESPVVIEPDAGVTTEQVDVRPVDQEIEVGCDVVEQLRRG